MAYTVYDESRGTTAEAQGGGDTQAGKVGGGSVPFELTTNSGSIDGPGSGGTTTNTFTSAMTELGRIDIAGKKVVVKIETLAVGDITNVAATATFTFDTDAKVETDPSTNYIALTDANGVSETFWARENDERSDEFAVVASGTTCATNFKALVNASSLAIAATGSGAAVVLTQETSGYKGNTLIDDGAGFAAMCVGTSGVAVPAAFTSGADVDFFCEFSPTGVNGQWTKYTAVAADVTYNNTGVSIANNLTLAQTGAANAKVFQLDLTAIKAPYIRLGINSQGLELDEDFSVTIGITYPLGYVRNIDKETWNAKGEREG